MMMRNVMYEYTQNDVYFKHSVTLMTMVLNYGDEKHYVLIHINEVYMNQSFTWWSALLYDSYIT